MINRFLRQLMQRRVVHAAVAYLASSLVILRLADTLGRLFDLTALFQQILAIALMLGFPFAMVWVWRHGIATISKRRSEKATVELEVLGDGATQDLSLDSGRMRNLLIIVMMVLALAIVAMIVDRLMPMSEPGADSRTSERSERGQGIPSAPARSIAVLPFVNMSADEEQEYFSDGLTEELLNLLAKIPELHVTSRTSAFAFKGEKIDIPEVAQRLNVAHILEGSVRKGGDQVRITAQLIEAELGLAYATVGKQSYEAETWQAARHAFERALAIDQDLPEAWIGLVDVVLHAWEFEKAQEYLEKAMALEGSNPSS